MFAKSKEVERRLLALEALFKKPPARPVTDPELEGHIAYLTGAVRMLQQNDQTAEKLAPHIASLSIVLKDVGKAIDRADEARRSLATFVREITPARAKPSGKRPVAKSKPKRKK